jgi:hypothetical protein
VDSRSVLLRYHFTVEYPDTVQLRPKRRNVLRYAKWKVNLIKTWHQTGSHGVLPTFSMVGSNGWHAYNRNGRLFACRNVCNKPACNWLRFILGSTSKCETLWNAALQVPPGGINARSWPHTGPLFPVPLSWSDVYIMFKTVLVPISLES